MNVNYRKYCQKQNKTSVIWQVLVIIENIKFEVIHLSSLHRVDGVIIYKIAQETAIKKNQWNHLQVFFC